MNRFSIRDKLFFKKKAKQEVFDLVVIGGGINGAGVAREAVLRGMNVLLLEARDFAFGTSSRSSKLIHGGIRYLENGEFHLVFEALSERAWLFESAPHLVHPLKFLIPVYNRSRVPPWKLHAGMILYDLLSGLETPHFHEKLNFDELIEEYPTLLTQGLRAGFRYSDAYMDDDRLVVETLRSVMDTGRLVALNHSQVIQASKAPQGGWELRVKDQLSGEQWIAQGQSLIAAVGPWTDDLRLQFNPKASRILRPSKGIHLTFEKDRIPLKTAVVMAVEERIVFVIPRHDMVIIGTTDTDYQGSLEDVRAETEDINYLLNVVSQYFPRLQLTEGDIVGHYAGVRPLIMDDSVSVGKTSREHSIWSEGGITWIAGGKYTTYRAIGEEVLDYHLNQFPVDDQVKWKKSYSLQALNPRVSPRYRDFLPDLVTELREHFPHWGQQELEVLAYRYGEEALDFASDFGSGWDYPQIEALYAMEYGFCSQIVDFYYRRVPWVFSHSDHGLSFLDSVKLVWKEYQEGLLEEELEAQVKVLLSEIQKSTVTHKLK